MVQAKIDGFIDYVWALMGTIMDAQGNQHLHSDDWHRTVYIDTLGVSTVDFDLEPARKRDLVESDLAHTQRYFNWYDGDFQGEPPENKPPADFADSSPAAKAAPSGRRKAKRKPGRGGPSPR